MNNDKLKMKDETNAKQIFILHFSLIINQVFHNYQVFYNKDLTLHGILSHVKLQQFLYSIGFTERDLLQTHVFSDKSPELIGRDLPQTLESFNFRIVSKLFDGCQTFFLRIAIIGFVLSLLAVTHTEKRGL